MLLDRVSCIANHKRAVGLLCQMALLYRPVYLIANHSATAIQNQQDLPGF